MRTQLLIVTLFLSQLSNAVEGEFAFSKIPVTLLKNANSVVRLDETHLQIISKGKARMKARFVITVLNEQGDKRASFVKYYTKFERIESIEGYLYDASGSVLRKMKMKDAEDLSGTDDGSLIDDYRVKAHGFFHKIYPYSVEYIYEVEYNSTLFFPSWTGLSSDKQSAQQSSITITSPIDYEFRYKAFKYEGEPVRTQKEKTKSATWSASNLPAILKEPYSPMWHELVPMVIFGPTEFEVEDYKGNMSSWQEFGKFVYALNKGKDILPDAIKQKVHQLTDGITDINQRIAVLYEYLQKNTRYISIQLGIGGWQPFDAKYVATKSYGDCKALTNYMFSLLKEAGVTSYYALVKSGSNGGYITHDFPSSQFDHVILCVPLKNDTLWLECTSQTLPSGYIGEFTSNRYALLIEESGGKLVRTTSYDIDDNLQLRKIDGVLLEDGTLQIKAETKYNGLQQDDIHGMINHLSKDKVKEYLHEQLDFATYDISRFEYKEAKSVLPSIREQLDISVSNYATITGKRLFIVPNVMSRSHRKPAADPDRKYDIVFGTPYQDFDTVSIQLPDGYSTESLPSDVNLSSQFGKYSSSVKLSGKQLLYNRHIEFFGGRFPAKDYGEMVKFFETIYKADRSKVVLVKTEQPAKGF